MGRPLYSRAGGQEQSDTSDATTSGQYSSPVPVLPSRTTASSEAYSRAQALLTLNNIVPTFLFVPYDTCRSRGYTGIHCCTTEFDTAGQFQGDYVQSRQDLKEASELVHQTAFNAITGPRQNLRGWFAERFPTMKWYTVDELLHETGEMATAMSRTGVWYDPTGMSHTGLRYDVGVLDPSDDRMNMWDAIGEDRWKEPNYATHDLWGSELQNYGLDLSRWRTLANVYWNHRSSLMTSKAIGSSVPPEHLPPPWTSTDR